MSSFRKYRSVLLLAAAGVAVAAQALRHEPAEESAGVAGALAPCADESGRCGVVEVPEDPARPDGRAIGLNVRVLPATGQETRPDPLFILAGGPGQAATDVAPLVAPLLGDVRERRDLVFVDQRGTGASNPLTCEIDEEAALDSGRVSLSREDVESCLAELDADPRFYATPVAMDDLDRVRDALGYEEINLWGGSYGTRAASVYMRRHPDRVRAAILDGMAPVHMSLPLHFAADGQRALDLALSACAEDPACAERFGSLGASIEDLLRSLDHDPPERVPVRHPRTGEWEEVPLGRDAVAAALRGVLYSPNLTTLVPLIVEQALVGDFGPLAVLSDPVGGPQLELGMFLSVVCAEDVPFLDRAEAERAGGDTIFGHFIVDAFAESCVHWPSGSIPDGYREPVRSDAPTLLLSGELDPVTPPHWADRAAETLPNSRHLVIPGTGHGTLRAGCVPSLIAEFLETADPRALDASCAEEISRPPFWTAPTGPRP